MQAKKAPDDPWREHHEPINAKRLDMRVQINIRYSQKQFNQIANILFDENHSSHRIIQNRCSPVRLRFSPMIRIAKTLCTEPSARDKMTSGYTLTHDPSSGVETSGRQEPTPHFWNWRTTEPTLWHSIKSQMLSIKSTSTMSSAPNPSTTNQKPLMSPCHRA